MKYLLLFISTFLFQQYTYAQEEYFIIADKTGSAPAMAENTLTIHRLLYDFENKHIKPTYWKEDKLKGKALGVGFRFLKTVLLDVHIDFLLHTNQHLFFGKGYRLREFGFTQNEYNIFLFPPYGYGGGFARPGNNVKNRQLGLHETVVLESGGVEAVYLMSQKLRTKWLLRGSINYRETLLYLSTLYESTFYTVLSEIFDYGNYSRRYTENINNAYGFDNEEKYPLSHEFIAERSLVNFLNTYQFFAIYTYLKTYLFDGKENQELPMINFGKTKWLPSIRFGFTPLGSEFILENQFLRNSDFMEVTLRKGDQRLAKQWGVGLKAMRKFNEHLTLEGIFNFWNQGSMNLGGDQVFDTKEGLGGMLSLTANYHINQSPTGFYTQLGYKTTGYWEGEQLDEGMILRLGLSFRVQDYK